jgi:hypothetical protein
MARLSGRASRVEVAGPLAPFVDVYEAELPTNTVSVERRAAHGHLRGNASARWCCS